MAAGDFNPLSLVGSGIGGIFQYAGAKKQADAQEKAASLQAASAQEALDFTKGQKAKQEVAAAPYLAVGQQAVANLSGAVRPGPSGPPPTPYSTAPGGMPQGQQTGYSTLSMAQSPSAYGFAPKVPAPAAGPAGGGMVTLQAPDGTTRSVPSNLVQSYISRGAKVVG